MEKDAVKRTGCVVLAAGRGLRFGGDKLGAGFRGEPLYARALALAGSADFAAVAVVSGREDVLSAAEERGFFPVRNDAPEQGISRSVRLGLKALGPVDAALFLVADQPLLRPETVRRLLRAGESAPDSIIVPVRPDGAYGNPCLFPARFFPELMALEGDRGGRRVISAHEDAVIPVPAAEDELADVDRREDLEALGRR